MFTIHDPKPADAMLTHGPSMPKPMDLVFQVSASTHQVTVSTQVPQLCGQYGADLDGVHPLQ